MLTIAPRRSIRLGRAARVARTALSTLTSNIRVHSVSSASRKLRVAWSPPPTLLTSRSPDVVERADVSRSTFYDHYRDVHELAEAASTSMIDDLLASLSALDPAPGRSSDPREDPDPALTAFFTHFAEHAGLYRSLLGPTGSARVIEHIRLRTTAAAYLSPLLPAADDTPEWKTADPSDMPHNVPAAFVAGALLGVATDWLQRGCPRTPRAMTNLIHPLLAALSDSTGTAPAS
jgi:AcrR family transcriptional regulator